jgi:hypothetical protein
MSKAKCNRCGATAQSDTFEQARKQLNHAIGLARGIKCGDSYGAVKEIGKPIVVPSPSRTTKTQTTKKEEQTISASPETISDISPNSGIISPTRDTSPKTKTSSKKFKDIKS